MGDVLLLNMVGCWFLGRCGGCRDSDGCARDSDYDDDVIIAPLATSPHCPAAPFLTKNECESTSPTRPRDVHCVGGRQA